MAKYVVYHKTKQGSIQGAGIFKTKKEAEDFVRQTKKNKAFKQLGYSGLRIRREA